MGAGARSRRCEVRGAAWWRAPLRAACASRVFRRSFRRRPGFWAAGAALIQRRSPLMLWVPAFVGMSGERVWLVRWSVRVARLRT